jgi:hypothetical protein
MRDKKPSPLVTNKAFGETGGLGEPPPRPGEVVTEIVWVLGLVTYMAAAIALLTWTLRH